MIEDIKEAALNYIKSDRECNFYSANHKLTLQIHGGEVDVESIWYQKDEDKVYLHCGCPEFEGDIDVESLSDKNQERLREVLQCARIKSRQRGDQIIRCIVHVDVTGRNGMGGRFDHLHEYCGSEEAAVRWMNDTLPFVLDDAATMASTDDLIAVNAALAEQYDEPANLNAYASIENITEEVIIKCSETFCEHHWSHKALVSVADELGVDLYDIEKQ